jgi:hypothetical protein
MELNVYLRRHVFRQAPFDRVRMIDLHQDIQESLIVYRVVVLFVRDQ